MVDIIEAILLGIIQGATEFLPISSSGHLLLIPSLFNLDEPNLNAIAMAHQGTLLAVIFYFRHDLWQIISSVYKGIKTRRPFATAHARLGWYIAAGSIPAIIAGLLFEDILEKVLTNPSIEAVLLICTAAILVLGERALKGGKTLSTMALPDAMVIGLAQALALLPGISRSGVTMSTGLGRSFDRSTAARFSFLLGVPVIAGAGLLAALELAQAPDIGDQLGYLVATFITAFIVGYLCIYFLLKWVRQHSLYIFAVYCALAGSLYLLIEWIR
ncbi:MAG: undecaprenyl-diphosphate phosphatase [Candidatus Promineifilaceae bacterium]